MTRTLERETLARFDFDIREAVDGKQALELMDRTPPDLVLLGVDMPGMDGFEVCPRIRQRWDATQMPVIMVTDRRDLDSINHYRLRAIRSYQYHR